MYESRCRPAASATAMNTQKKEAGRALQYPRIPGHEVAGVIDAVGAGVSGWETGQRAGVGWHGGHCGYCNSCRRGDFVTCSKGRQITGLTRDGGYADYVIVSAGGLVAIPDGLSAGGSGASALRRRHDVQRAAQQRRARRRRRRRTGAWRPRPSGRAVCREDGIRDRLHRPRDKTKKRSRDSSARSITSTARRRMWSPNSRNWEEPK